MWHLVLDMMIEVIKRLDDPRDFTNAVITCKSIYNLRMTIHRTDLIGMYGPWKHGLHTATEIHDYRHCITNTFYKFDRMVNKTYYYRGTIIEEANYRKGRKHGRSIDGYALDRYAVSNYRNGKLNGELATYVGETIQTVMHYVDNVEHGRYERYNLSGDLIYEATYRNGKLDGTSNAYDDYGKLINSVVYVDGEVIRVSY